MKVSEFFKGFVMMAVGVPVVAIIDWFQDLQDRERLRVANAKRRKEGKPPFKTMWEYYTSQRHDDA
jgi:hypothetical protein